jgi:hypothetical protein
LNLAAIVRCFAGTATRHEKEAAVVVRGVAVTRVESAGCQRGIGPDLLYAIQIKPKGKLLDRLRPALLFSETVSLFTITKQKESIYKRQPGDAALPFRFHWMPDL